MVGVKSTKRHTNVFNSIMLGSGSGITFFIGQIWFS